MRIAVFSEIGALRKVLIHRPGPELEQLTPPHLSRMLFDDIPFLQGAQREHDRFDGALRSEGVQVCYLKDMVAQSLEAPGARDEFIEEFITLSGRAAVSERAALRELFAGIRDNTALVEKTMAGVTYEEAGLYPRYPLTRLVRRDANYLLDPIPNLYFTRDPFSVIGHGVATSSMFAPARRREAIYGNYIFKYHPDYAGQVKSWYQAELPFSLEGGDILNLGKGVLGVGLSQRTAPEAIEQLCRNLSADADSGIQSILVFDIPNVRAFMHLDTVFTQVDAGTFTIHPGILPVLRCFKLRMEGGTLSAKELPGSLEDILRRELGLDRVTLIHCGGSDSIAAEREQWNDGSNTLCVRPGTVIVYDRNTVTNRILEDHGIRTIEIPGSELGRGRGGPRCMSMPLLRDRI